MTAKVDDAGKIELPAAFRERFGVKPGDVIDFGEVNGAWIVKVAADGLGVRWEHGVLVYTGRIGSDPISAIDEIRNERVDKFLQEARP